MSSVFPGDDAGACASVGYKPWFPGKGETATAAKRICRTCPVLAPCLDYALRFDVKGVWGGTHETDREALRAELGIKAKYLLWDVA